MLGVSSSLTDLTRVGIPARVKLEPNNKLQHECENTFWEDAQNNKNQLKYRFIKHTNILRSLSLDRIYNFKE